MIPQASGVLAFLCSSLNVKVNLILKKCVFLTSKLLFYIKKIGDQLQYRFNPKLDQTSALKSLSTVREPRDGTTGTVAFKLGGRD